MKLGLLRLVLAVLVVIGVAAAMARAMFPADLVIRAEPIRTQLLQALDRHDPLMAERPAELARFDGRFAAHPVLTYVHVLFGAAFLLLAPLQFSARIRSRHLRFHRWSGRLLVGTALVSVAAGLYFGLLMPFGGLSEALAIALFGSLLFVTMGRAVVAIRRGQVALHREWMIRAFAVMIAISTVRVVAAVMDYALTPAGLRPADGFAVSLWTGWILTLATAELWIRRTRPRARASAVPASAA